MEYSIQELSRLSGVTTRTLRWYDQIGLLKPSRVAESGYRYYGRAEVDRLQDILYYRALGVELARIKECLDDPSFDRLAALKSHLAALEAERERLMAEYQSHQNDIITATVLRVDPRTGKSLMDRTVLIANTSNMPVAAREASIYTGITLAEYYRDMGYHTAMMADSTSRWAEALREISGRLEEMPADEGYPAYLPSRLAEFYERAGYVKTLNGAEGSVSVIGAVSPQGNDFSEPVTQNTKRFTRCFWALDKSLAYARHYPAINWNDSYSEYLGDLGSWYYDNVGHDFMSCRERVANLLLQENNLMQIVKLIGSDVLPDDQKLTIEIARVIRVGFLQQNAFHAVDTYVPLEKQLKMMETILYLYDKCAALVAKQVPVSRLLATGLFDELVKMKYEVPNDDFSKLDAMQKDIDAKLAAVAQG